MITISTVLVMSGQGIIAPVLPLFATRFGASIAAVGLTLSIFALARLLLNVPLGMLADRRGRRPLLVIGPLVSAVGMAGSGLANGIPDLLAWRFVAGAGSSMYMTAAAIYLADISSVQNRARYIATNQGALLVGVSVGPAIGGLLADALGLRAPFLAVGLASAVAALYGYLRLPETRPEAPPADASSAEGDGASWRRLVASPDFLAVSAVTASVFLTRAAGRMTLMPLLAASQLGYSASAIGAVFAAMATINLIGIAPAALLSDRFGRKWAIVPSGLLIAGALALMSTAGTSSVFLLAALALAVGTSVTGPAPAAYAADIAAPRLRGLAMGLYRSAGDVGFVAGPVLLGALADATTIGWALGTNAAIVLASTAGFALVARETLGLATSAAGEPRARDAIALDRPPPRD